jgi:hypothetical protein
MRTLRELSLGVIGALVAASPLLAHHDWPVDRTNQVTVQGTVTAFTWADPHVMIALDVQTNGTIEKWKVGGSNKKNSAANGWDKNTLKPGTSSPNRLSLQRRINAAQLQKIVMANGKEIVSARRSCARSGRDRISAVLPATPLAVRRVRAGIAPS